MKTLFRTLVIIALSAWLGGLIFFPFLAQIAFSVEPSRQTAGLIVGTALIALHKIGLVSGALLMALLLAAHLRRTMRQTLYPAMLLLAVMIALTAISQFSIIPRMERHRLAAGGSVSLAPLTDPDRIAFERLHHTSVSLESGVLFAGLMLATALAWADGEPPRHHG